MALDIHNLSATELIRLVNSTMLGTVLNAPKLNRQRNVAGYRIGDGKRINLVRYVAWRIREREKPQAEPLSYEERKRRQAQRNADLVKAGQDIAPIPDVEDMDRRLRACDDFRFFCETYFPQAFFRDWSDDHLRVIEKIERAVTEGGLFAFAMPRGSGKTTLARMSGLWAILSGRRPYVCLIGGSKERATDLLAPIRTEILHNGLLQADFPDAIYPLRKLENNARRQGSQHIAGKLTLVRWSADKLVFPSMVGDNLPMAIRKAGHETAPAGGSIITVTSLDSNIRGQQHTRPDGRILRPSLVLLDDPQTRESARSAHQTKFRLQLLNGDVLGMAGPGESIAGVLTCTKIYEGDLADEVLDPEKCPEWQGECTKMIYAFPTNEQLWQKYADLRSESLRAGNGGREATEFYGEHREAMDEGAVVAWPDRYDRDKDLSALQHAMNLKLRDEEAFFAEYQNEPLVEQESDEVLTPDQVASRINGRKRGEVPLACSHVTMFIDVHDKLLFYLVAAWAPDFTGYVIDYGTYPDQRRAYFTMRDARRTLARMAPGAGKEGAIQAGMEKLTAEYLSRDWRRADGASIRIERCLVDSGYLPGVVANVCHKAGAAMMPSKGIGLTAGRKPMSTYRRQPGELHGHNWYMPNVRKTGEFRHVMIDTNHWKGFVHARLATEPGDKGCLTLFGSKESQHRLFADHVAGSESWTRTEGHGRVVQEWRLRPGAPDNHFFDCLVGCAVAASMSGATLPGFEPVQERRRKRYTQRDLRRR